MPITIGELLYIWMIDVLVILNRCTIRKDLTHHVCKDSHIQCDMLERECGVPRSTVLNERHLRKYNNR